MHAVIREAVKALFKGLALAASAAVLALRMGAHKRRRR
jgi:hypothetical protein